MTSIEVGKCFEEDDFVENIENVGEKKHNKDCIICGKKSLKNLKRHVQAAHEHIKYSCNQCDYQATQKGHVKTHIQSVHEKIKYSCNQCDYQATEKGSLKRHIQSVHEKMKYS